MLSRLFAYLDAGDREGLLATLCDLVPECVSPLRSHYAEPVALLPPLSAARVSGAWHAVMDLNQSSWRDRRRTNGRVPPALDVHIEERRQGVVCRRKEVRAGGRRRTDVGVLLPAGSSATG
jgi:hypothetical protein